MAVDPPARSLAAPAAFNPAEIDLSSAAFNAARYLAVTHANTSFPELQTALDELRKTTSDKTAQLKALVSAHFDQYLSCHEAVRALAADVTTHQRETETLLADMQHLRRVADASLAVMLQRAREQRRIRHTLAVLARLRPILELTGKMKASLRLQDYDTLAVDYARLKHQSGRISGLAPSLKRVVTAGHEIAATANAELLRRLEDMSVSVTDQKRAIDVLTALGLVEKPILTCLTKQFEYLERKFAEIDDQEASKLGSEEVMKECVAIVGRFRGGLWGFICDLFKIPTGNAAATSNTITSVEAERVQQQAWSILSRCVKLLEHHASPPSAPRLKLLTEAFRQLRYLKKCPNATTLNANIEQLNEFFCYKFRTTITLAYLEQNVEIKCMDIYSSAHSEPLQRVLRAGAAEEPLQSHNNSSSRHSSRVNTRTGSANLAVQEPLQAPTTIPTVTTSMPSDPRQYVFNVLLQLITLRSEVEMSVGGYPQCWDYVRSVTDPLTAALAEFLQDSMRGLVNASNASAFEEWKRSHLLVEARFFQLALNDLMAVSTKTQLEDVEKQLMQAKPGDQANAGHVTLLNQMKHQTKLYLLALQQ
ncbi:Vacuolar-sorting receptor 1 [Phytophthora boehmeriae]|uniref:Exocyst complex component n=1 Tax=Phytophthora boehmeriae TaxID=109152 RepID=A0A8T1WZ06_9STRA|nr:Vacuolar-sorting receptor 1 [Phytophthora boehmeriae]